MRRLVFLLITLLAFSACAFGEEAPEAVAIRDLDGLKALAGATGRYILQCDIDLSGEDWTPIPFSGELDGQGYGLYNLHVTKEGAERAVTRDGNMKEYDTTFSGLFSVLSGTVRDLKLIGAEVMLENESHCFAGLLAGMADHATIRGCTLSGRVHMFSHGVNCGVGGIAGYGCGVFDRCTADVELVYEDRHRESKCEQFMGGILACGIADLTDNEIDIDGYDSCHGYVHNGGLVGMYYQCGMDYPRGPMYNNTARGRIRFFEDNRDRRAYCRAFIGESLHEPRPQYNNHDRFRREEVRQYDTVLMPEMCENPVYTETLSAPEGAQWGCTVHTCTSCGYEWRDSYTPPDPASAAPKTVHIHSR